MRNGIVLIGARQAGNVSQEEKLRNPRLCIDYGQLNKVIKVSFPPPVIEDQINAREGARIMNTLDIKSAFFSTY